MLTATQTCELLERASDLHARRNYSALEELLSALPHKYLLAEPELGHLLAVAWAATGRDVDALELARELVRPCERRGRDRLYFRRQNLEGAIHLYRGELVEAEALLSGAFGLAAQLNDYGSIAAATHNLALIALIRCEWDRGLALLQRAMSAYESVGDRTSIGLCHHNIAMAYRSLGLFEASDTHFQHAFSYAHASGNDRDLIGTESERALLLAFAGDSRLGETTALRALQRARKLRERRLEGELLRVLGTIARRTEEREKALWYLRSALEVAQQLPARLLQAEILEELAFLEAEGNSTYKAALFGERAAKLYREMQADIRSERLLSRLRADRVDV